MPENSFKTGKIKWYNGDKGYGFIDMGDNGGDVFIHAKELLRSGINRSLTPGETVSFVPGQGPKGPFATHISLGIPK